MPQFKQYKLDDFPLKNWEKVRYSDMDKHGHVNNSYFSTYMETGRTELFYHPDYPFNLPECYFVIARLHLEFINEIRWPGRIEIGTGLTRIGNSSLTLQQGVFQEEKLCGIAETVVVQVSDETRKPRLISEESKERLKAYLMG